MCATNVTPTLRRIRRSLHLYHHSNHIPRFHMFCQQQTTGHFQVAADEGLPEALAALGIIYKEGLLMKTANRKLSSEYLLQATIKGSGAGTFALATIYKEDGKVLAAARLYKLAAARGIVDASFEMGTTHFNHSLK